jgi:hypothetical protein
MLVILYIHKHISTPESWGHNTRHKFRLNISTISADSGGTTNSERCPWLIDKFGSEMYTISPKLLKDHIKPMLKVTGNDIKILQHNKFSTRGGSRIFRTSVKIFLADGALSALGVVSTGRGRLQAWGGREWALNNCYADSPPLDF